MSISKRNIFSVIIATIMIVSFPALANFMVYPMSSTVVAGNDSLIRVYSKSEATQYIRINVKKIVNPATETEKEENVQSWNENNLIASPNKIILPAGGSKAVRMTQIEPPENEVLYRVYFESVSAEPDKKEVEVGNGKTKASLSLNIVFAALVRVLPKKVNIALEAKLDESKIILKNIGNVRAGVQKISLCNNDKINSECSTIDLNKFIYPKAENKIPIAFGKKFSWVIVQIKKDDGEKITLPLRV